MLDWNEEALPGELVQATCNLVLVVGTTTFPENFPITVDLLRHDMFRPYAELIVGRQWRQQQRKAYV